MCHTRLDVVTIATGILTEGTALDATSCNAKKSEGTGAMCSGKIAANLL